MTAGDLRLLWVTNDLPPRAGGIERFVDALAARAWPDAATVLGPAHPDAADHDATAPYEVVRAPRGVWPTRSVLDLAAALGEGRRSDAVVLGASWPLGRLAAPLRDRLGVPVVALSHGLEAGLATAGLGALVRAGVGDLDAVGVISEWTRQRLERALAGVHVERVTPGVDADVFHPDVDGAGIRGRWGVPADARLVGCISRLVRRKGQDRLLDAWPDVAARHPDAWLAVVGTGPLEAALRRRASTLERVVVTGGVAWDDLPAAYATLDVFAMPCRTRRGGTDVEGLGIVYLEAQAAGVPVVAGRSGGAPEAVRDGVTGVVVDGRSSADVAAAIDRLLADADLRTSYGRAGRAWVEREWTWPSVADRFRALVTGAVARG